MSLHVTLVMKFFYIHIHKSKGDLRKDRIRIKRIIFAVALIRSTFQLNLGYSLQI